MTIIVPPTLKRKIRREHYQGLYSGFEKVLPPVIIRITHQTAHTTAIVRKLLAEFPKLSLFHD